MIKKILVSCVAYFKYRNIKFNSIGENVNYKSLKSTFMYSDNCILKDNIYIGPGAHFDCAGGLDIESNVIFAPDVTIYTRNHYFDGDDLRSLPFDNRVVLKKVEIQSNVWIGKGVIILPGVIVGEGTVVGAGSVVTKSVPKYSLVGGNPAKVIRTRNIEVYLKLKSEGRFVYSDFGHAKEFVRM